MNEDTLNRERLRSLAGKIATGTHLSDVEILTIKTLIEVSPELDSISAVRCATHPLGNTVIFSDESRNGTVRGGMKWSDDRWICIECGHGRMVDTEAIVL